jgi:hypothetical protein
LQLVIDFPNRYGYKHFYRKNERMLSKRLLL